MDNFTMFVIVGDLVVLGMFGLMLAFDRKGKPVTPEPAKPAGKRPA
jgi:hypothetical protein